MHRNPGPSLPQFYRNEDLNYRMTISIGSIDTQNFVFKQVALCVNGTGSVTPSLSVCLTRPRTHAHAQTDRQTDNTHTHARTPNS